MKHPMIFLLFVLPGIYGFTPDIEDGNKDRDKIVNTAMDYINTRYKAAGTTPSGFDCSGFPKYVYNRALNVNLKHGSKLQARSGKKIETKKAKKGDLIFFRNKGNINHVGVISKVSKGEIWVIHATSSKGVILEDVNNSSYWRSRIAFVRTYI
jgi:cell wall-associated NlpC family hydrolase